MDIQMTSYGRSEKSSAFQKGSGLQTAQILTHIFLKGIIYYNPPTLSDTLTPAYHWEV